MVLLGGLHPVATSIKKKGGFAHFHFYGLSKPVNAFLKRKKD